uniref:Uncharacterized protein n=1 Tax=Siphoviridae sp. ctSP74 TaxID=2826343 RepID=A0A8S5NPG6_9CAUD|nr:MAG TPA: hypothetical protein [Siphoviridae sp. ctSP74]
MFNLTATSSCVIFALTLNILSVYLFATLTPPLIKLFKFYSSFLKSTILLYTV